MRQSIEELNSWYATDDPWGYNRHPDDAKRRTILLSAIPSFDYNKTLDIGCGNAFITRHLPGRNVTGMDISSAAIEQSKKVKDNRLNFVVGSIFDVNNLFITDKFDLIVITGVLYEQYIGNSIRLLYILIDNILNKGGVLATVHIDEWYSSRFPYLMIDQQVYEYRDYLHKLEIYVK
jgi:trans-aconitate methyltransferase